MGAMPLLITIDQDLTLKIIVEGSHAFCIAYWLVAGFL